MTRKKASSDATEGQVDQPSINFTEAALRKLDAGAERVEYLDAGQMGLTLRVSKNAKGRVSKIFNYIRWAPHLKKTVRRTLGRFPDDFSVKNGCTVIRVPLKSMDFAEWCEGQSMIPDANARYAYAASIATQRAEGGEE
jgi:hypothetical protein